MNVTPAALTWSRRAGIVKAVDRIDALVAAPDEAIRIFRQSYANEMDTTDPLGTVNKIVQGLKGYWHRNLFVQVWCGAHPTLTQLKQAVTLCHLNNLKTVGSSWFTGDYTQQDWDAATAAGVDAYGPQAYWGNLGFTISHALRYRSFWRVGQAPVLLLEVGRDKIEQGNAGWKISGVTTEQYALELEAYDAEISKDSYILGATPFTSGATKGWENFDMDPVSPLLPSGGLPVPTPPPTYSSPNHDGPRAQTLGVVLHATLGGSVSPQTEYAGTINWFNSPVSQVSAHAVVGPSGQVAYPVDPINIAWHCRASNATWLGIEMCKAKIGDIILPDILDAAAKIVAGWCTLYKIPIVWSTAHGLAEHREMPTNTDGHQDVGGPFDRADFLRRVQTYGGELTDQQKAAVLDDLDFIYAYAKVENITKDPAEAQRVIQSRAIALKTTLGLNG
jgi:hypothetical protein